MSKQKETVINGDRPFSVTTDCIVWAITSQCSTEFVLRIRLEIMHTRCFGENKWIRRSSKRNSTLS